MAQSKPTPRPAKKSVGKPTANGLKGRPPAKKPGRSIVNQKQTPWTTIIIAAVLVIFAGGIIAFALTRHHSSTSSTNAWAQPELAEAKKDIPGLIYKAEPNHTHTSSNGQLVKYDTTPPTGGDHSPYWADCSGTVYPNAIANENAVHMLEHGTVWITYNKDTLSASGVATLSKLVQSYNSFMAMSPYPNLKTPISLQAWGYQLFVNSPTDPRIQKFIDLLRNNPKTTPEYGASCSQPSFKAHPSTFGHPLVQPAS